MNETTGSAALSANEEAVRETDYKKAIKRLARLEKQNAFLIDELAKSRQCLAQMKVEREVILDRVADSIIENENEDFDDEEDISDISDSESTPISNNLKGKKELIDELMDQADSDEAFARVLSELSGYQPAVSGESKKKSISLNVGSAAATASGNLSAQSSSSSAAAAGKKRKPPTSGSRFNRLSPFSQAMRTGIISDDETSGHTNGNYNNESIVHNNSTIDHFTNEYTDSEDFGFEGDEPELAQLKKVRRGSISGNQSSSITPATQSQTSNPSKEDTVALKVIPVPYDSEGNPILPLSLNMITVHRLGEIIHDRPAYHNKRYILPSGFTTSRSYLSVLSAEGSINYFSTIIDNGPAPLYQVTPEGHPEIVYQSNSTTGAWAAVAKAAAALRGKDSAPSVSGPDYFGLANPTVSMLIEQLQNADKCESYIPKKYEVSNLVGGKVAKRSESLTTPANNNITVVDVGNDDKFSNTSTGHQNESNIDNSVFDIHQNYM